jgi:deoxyadenosine/deoxycytidine kinase
MSPILVSLEGNIGSGKSTILAAISKRMDAAIDGARVTVLQEPVDRWSSTGMLQAYYNDPKRNGFAFQMFVMLSRVEQWQKLRSKGGGVAAAAVLSERCIASDFELFGQPMRNAGIIDDVQWTTYSAWTEHIRSNCDGAEAAAVIYLRVSPEVSIRRITTRGRPGEEAIDGAYIEMLHAAHEQWIARLQRDGARILTLDGDKDGEAAVQEHVDAIASFIEGAFQKSSDKTA